MPSITKPATPIHPDSLDWELYYDALDAEADCPDLEPESDAEWLEIQATYYESIHSDRALVAAKALRDVVTEMTILGVFTVSEVDERRESHALSA